MAVSARECAASESIAEDPLIRPATAFATAMARFIAPASTTVPTLSSLTVGGASVTGASCGSCPAVSVRI
ncbi:hypothetical protein Pen01_14160 [Phytomonospora endophytica]|nr:hypothetical protein Pen01_14160 [Phytomonospora endophytica]